MVVIINLKQNMTEQEEWDDYYQKVREGYRAQTFFALKKLIASGATARVKDFLKEKMADPRWLENVPKPKARTNTT